MTDQNHREFWIIDDECNEVWKYTPKPPMDNMIHVIEYSAYVQALYEGKILGLKEREAEHANDRKLYYAARAELQAERKKNAIQSKILEDLMGALEYYALNQRSISGNRDPVSGFQSVLWESVWDPVSGFQSVLWESVWDEGKKARETLATAQAKLKLIMGDT